ncbi:MULTISPECIES: PucR family transcriptional regulator [unclassified Nocardioides]|uniref:PucR family transcriptional regulator n=1 Tax=unclassified Nocardioides TaxID=2615069 RepID=UPI0006F9832F|nr:MULTISPECIES: PucR family transcriptional regulator [unclassified Nocardioides]KQY51695.1 PucR family transcriptional regulator [Nocardioides sp. Root140]KQZ70757.1 PucR family transcriptional regulator [Nocardioides sp. Root151]KRF10895.1 PucR family transcriptional regulator [Nocardioides sp. Soil796]
MTRPTTPREDASALLQRAVGPLSTAAMAGMDTEKAWFRDLSAENRSWVGMIVQAGIRGFISWFRDHADSWDLSTEADSPIAAQVFGAAPRALAGVITLQQTVDLVRLTIDVVEANLDDLLGAELAPVVHEGLLRYGRELAFATAEVYARAAESRGAWDARLEALVVDSVLRSESDETVLSRASALGWGGSGEVVVVLGRAAPGSTVNIFDDVRRSARAHHMDALCAVQGDRMVVILGGVEEPESAVRALSKHFAEGPIVFGPVAPDLGSAHHSATAALAGFRVAAAWPQAPRPVAARDLLPERVLAGHEDARRQLIEEVYLPLKEGRGTLIETLDAYFGHGGSVEGTARSLFVHPNTIRYRLRQAAELTGLTASQPRDGYTLAVALTCGRLSET